MNSNQKFTYGLIIEISGAFLFAIGVGISFTLIGACLGIPMALVGVPLMIWGTVWLFQARAEKTKEVIAIGIQQGLTRHEPTQIRSGPSPIVRASPNQQSTTPPPIPPALIEESKPLEKEDNTVDAERADRNDDEEEQLI